MCYSLWCNAPPTMLPALSYGVPVRERRRIRVNERQLYLAESDVHRMAGMGELTCQPHGLIALRVSQLSNCESVVLK